MSGALAAIAGATVAADAGKTQEQAEAEVQWYEHHRCACGGSPITLDPGSQRHLATCTAILDFFKRHNRYPWEGE